MSDEAILMFAEKQRCLGHLDFCWDAGDLLTACAWWWVMVAAGHSLGGALATLAAFDIRKQLLDKQQSNTQVVCYTFAAPRTGNHAFAQEYNAAVPDTWSVINDQVSPLPCCSCSDKTNMLSCVNNFGVGSRIKCHVT